MKNNQPTIHPLTKPSQSPKVRSTAICYRMNNRRTHLIAITAAFSGWLHQDLLL